MIYVMDDHRTPAYFTLYIFMVGHLLLPKYVRINTLKGKVGDVICELEKDGFIKKDFDEICCCKCLGHTLGGGTRINTALTYTTCTLPILSV